MSSYLLQNLENCTHFLNLAESSSQQKDYKKSLIFLKFALQKNPDQPSLLFSISNTYHLSENDLEIFSVVPSNKKHWNLLELAILNFNSVAVEMLLLPEYKLSFDLIQSSTLAKVLLTLIQSEEYLKTPNINISIKRNFIQEKRMQYPHLFNQSFNLGSFDRNVLFIKAEIYINNIITELNKRLKN